MDGTWQMPMVYRSSDTDAAAVQHGHTADDEDESVSQDEVTDTSFSDVPMGAEPAFYHDIEQGGLSISSHSQQVYSTIINPVVHADTSTMTSTDITPNRGVKNDLRYTPDETSVRHGEKIITIPASKSKLELLRNDKMLTSVQRRFPDVAITFEVNSGYLGLRGADTEVGVVKNAIEAALSKYTSLRHVWSPSMASALQQIPDAEDAIRSACMDHDCDGIVQFTPEGFEVSSDEEERAQAMIAAGMSAVRQWDITLKGDASGEESLPAWQELKSDVQGRHQGRILMTENQTHLSIVGVGPVDDDVTLLQDFIEQRVYLVEVKMDRAEYELLGLFLEDPEVNGSTLPAVKITFKEDTSQLVIKGCRNYVQYAEKDIKLFQAMVIREVREFCQPSMREFLESPDWTEEHRPQIEKRVKCKILEPHAAPSPHSDRRQEARVKHNPMSRSAPDLRRLNTEQGLKYTGLGPTPECEEEGAVGGALRGSCNIQQDDDDDVPSAEPVYSPSELYGHLPHSRSDASLPGLWTRRSTLSSEQQLYVPSNPRISLQPMSDVTEVEEDVLVNSTNAQLDLDLGQISQALLKSGGSTLQRECKTNYPSGIKRGDVAVTGIGRPGRWGQMIGRKPLQCKKLFHCYLPQTKNIEEMKSAVGEAVRKCLGKAETLRLASIAFPALGTGNLHYPPDIVAQVMYDAVLDYGRQHPKTIVLSVVILLHRKAEDARIRQAFKAEHEKYKQLLRDSLQSSQDETMRMSVVPSQAAKVEAYDHFTRASSRVRVTILAYRQTAVDEAEQELLDCYNKNVVSVSTNLDLWADQNIADVKRMCADLKVDLSFNYALRQVSFRGLHHNYVNIVRTMQDTMKHAEQILRQKRDTALLAEQVQWSVVEITKDGERHLLRYDVENNQRIEMAYREGKLYATLKVDSKSYMVDFATFEEKSYERSDAEPLRVIRQEKIEVTKEDGEVPTSHGWSAMNGQELDVVRAGSEEYTAVVDSLNKAPVEVVKIERVQNVGLHEQYMAMKRQIGSSVPSGCQHERDILWHGTSQESANSIIKHGFHRTYCDPEENNFGQGIYFTSSTESIHEDEFAVPSSSGERHVFRCKVLIGQYTRGDQRMRFPPDIRSANPSGRYNSTVDDPIDPKVFVIYSHLQAYPEYRIVFKKT